MLFKPIGGLLNNEPLIEQDYGLHFHHLTSMLGFWESSGRLWGYNPRFMAGYPSNTIQDASVKLFELVALVLRGLGAIRVFKIALFLSVALIPWIMFFAGRNVLEESEVESGTAIRAGSWCALLGTAYWWNSLPREMFFYGMVGFPSSSYMALLTLSLFWRVSKEERMGVPLGVGWIIAISILPALHVQSLVVFAVPATVLLISKRRGIRRHAAFWIALGILISALVNSIWLIPFWTHRGDDNSSALVAELPVFTTADPWVFAKDYFSTSGFWTFRTSMFEKGLRLALLIGGAAGMAELCTKDGRNKVRAVPLATAIASLFLLTYFGSSVRFLSAGQPLRFKVPLDLFLALSAGYFGSTIRLKNFPSPRGLFACGLMAFGGCSFFLNLIQTETKADMRLRTGFSPQIQAVVDWIANETPKSGRILFEESGDESGFIYDGMYLSSFVPQLTGRQLIGGPANLYNDRHHFAEFHSGVLFKRGIDGMSPAEIREYLGLYNIGAIVCFSPSARQSFQRLPDCLALERDLGKIVLIKVNQPLNWFLKGEGELAADLNAIHCSEVKGEEVILKYHWIAGIKSEPPLKIKPTFVMDDPIPFIKIAHPPSEFTLFAGKTNPRAGTKRK